MVTGINSFFLSSHNYLAKLLDGPVRRMCGSGSEGEEVSVIVPSKSVGTPKNPVPQEVRSKSVRGRGKGLKSPIMGASTSGTPNVPQTKGMGICFTAVCYAIL